MLELRAQTLKPRGLEPDPSFPLDHVVLALSVYFSMPLFPSLSNGEHRNPLGVF